MATGVADITHLLKGVPAGAWVAISERLHEVIAFGPDAQDVMRDARERGEEQPLLVRVPDRQLTSMFF